MTTQACEVAHNSTMPPFPQPESLMRLEKRFWSVSLSRTNMTYNSIKPPPILPTINVESQEVCPRDQLPFDSHKAQGSNKAPMNAYKTMFINVTAAICAFVSVVLISNIESYDIMHLIQAKQFVIDLSLETSRVFGLWCFLIVIVFSGAHSLQSHYVSVSFRGLLTVLPWMFWIALALHLGGEHSMMLKLMVILWMYLSWWYTYQYDSYSRF